MPFEYPRAFRRHRMVHGWGTCRDSWCQVHRRRLWFCHNPVFFFLFLHPLGRRFGAASQAEILRAAEITEMADVEQINKVVPFVTWEITFGQYVCELMLGVVVPKLNLGIQINRIKQPIYSNSVGSLHVSHCWTPAFWLSSWSRLHCPRRHTT